MAQSQPGMAGVAGRYARALFDLAQEDGALDRAGEELSGFISLLDDNPSLDHVLASPAVGLGEKTGVLEKVLNKAGLKGLVAQFLKLVARNNRLGELRAIAAAFKALVNAHRGEVMAEVTSAGPLSEKQLEALSSALQSAIGQEVKFDTRVDPGLLGGLIVKIGSRMIDNSLRTRLDNLRIAMKEVS